MKPKSLGHCWFRSWRFPCGPIAEQVGRHWFACRHCLPLNAATVTSVCPIQNPFVMLTSCAGFSSGRQPLLRIGFDSQRLRRRHRLQDLTARRVGLTEEDTPHSRVIVSLRFVGKEYLKSASRNIKFRDQWGHPVTSSKERGARRATALPPMPSVSVLEEDAVLFKNRTSRGFGLRRYDYPSTAPIVTVLGLSGEYRKHGALVGVSLVKRQICYPTAVVEMPGTGVRIFQVNQVTIHER